MNRILSVLLLTVVTVIGFSMYQQQDVGYIKIAFADFEFESSLLVVFAASLLVLFALSIIFNILGSVLKVFAYFGSRRHQRLSEKARQALAQGLIELAEGRFDKAEKILLTQVKHNDNALLAYLGAARAAQQQGAHDRRDKYLRLAHELTPDAETAISLTKAELQLDHEQYEQALATLTLLAERSPKHVYVLKLLARCYLKLSDWRNLNRLIPDIKKHNALSTQEIYPLEVSCWKGMLDDTAKTTNLKALTKLWNDVPRHLKLDADVIQHYASLLIKLESAGEAEQLLRHYLNNQWDETLIQQYAEIDVVSDNKQLETAEGWLQDHQQNAYLLLALGNMCTQRSLWGKARNYYEISISVKAMPENYLRLARLLEEHMGDEQAAQEYYRQGMHLLAGEYADDVLQKISPEFGRQLDAPALKVV